MNFQPNLKLNIVEPTSGSSPRLVTHYLGPAEQSLTTAATNTVFLSHYSGDESAPFAGPVRKLTFTQVGSRQIPNLDCYKATCQSVDFTGYVVTPKTLVRTVSELPKTTSVNIFIGAAEQHRTMLNLFSTKFFTTIRLCPHVATVKIIVDLEYYHELKHTCDGHGSRCVNGVNCPGKIKNLLGRYIMTLIQYVEKCFPSLQRFEALLPDNKNITKAVESLIDSCRAVHVVPQSKWGEVWPDGVTVEFHLAHWSEQLGRASCPRW